jgi:hypothetical protein
LQSVDASLDPVTLRFRRLMAIGLSMGSSFLPYVRFSGSDLGDLIRSNPIRAGP